MSTAAPPERLRLDKWLWHVRLQASRSKAAQLIRDGFVRIDGARATDPARLIRTGNVLTLALLNRTIVVHVNELPERRGSATAVARSYTILPSTGD